MNFSLEHREDIHGEVSLLCAGMNSVLTGYTLHCILTEMTVLWLSTQARQPHYSSSDELPSSQNYIILTSRPLLPFALPLFFFSVIPT
jgi:hypothetical protein